MERNTNRLEGGVNSLIKRTLARNHGLTEEHMRRAAECACYMKSESPDPHALIPDTGGGTRNGCAGRAGRTRNRE